MTIKFMPFLSLLIIAIVQGITEFLPVSSSGHLVLTHHLLEGGISDLCWEENRAIDVAVHLGTLLAVLLYFRKDLITMLTGLKDTKSEGFSLIISLTIASIPVIIAGFALHMLKPSFICMLQIMAWTTLIFGIVLWFADKKPQTKTLQHLTKKDALLIGLAQTLALIPGTSRSGITMTAGRFLGYSRTESAHFSLLLAIVAIGGAGVLSARDLFTSTNTQLGTDALIAIALSFIAGYTAISLMMKFLEKSTFKPFAIYRIILGTVLLGLIYSGAL